MNPNAILSQLSIRNPCPMDWDRMSGDNRVRYWRGCGKHVYNLTAMSPGETASLISTVAEQGQKRCVRLCQRPDGTLFASGCQGAPDGAARPWQFTIRFLMAVIAGCAAVLGLTRWLSPETKPPAAANTRVITGDLY